MQLTSITINNFKGIKHTKIELVPVGASIFTLIGLNESGKTTILEAISTFNIKKDETSALYSVKTDEVNPSSFVPKSLKSNFTGDITVAIEFELCEKDKEELIKWVQQKTEYTIVKESIPQKITITRGYKFENSDYKSKIYTIGWFHVKAIAKSRRKVEVVSSPKHLVWQKGTDFIIEKFPEINYFPTFIFNQPEKIILNPGDEEKPINRLYRQIIENIAASLDRPLDVQKHIVNRIIGDETTSEKILSFFMLAPDKQQQIEAALNEMSSHVTETVFSSWTKIFGGDFSGREIVLKLGVQNNTDRQEVYLQFAIKDRKSTYDISERSLGFRWFFSFLLFTFYRKAAAGKPTLFLLDEPASNLHARAQIQLLENLSKITTNGNLIIYSTHSHYLINPEWLDQAYIISNKAIDYENIDGRNDARNNGETLITADKYRNFVGSNPDKITYFQPVLDTLDVVPSKLDITKKSVLVEGKGDFLILEYGRRVIMEYQTDVYIVPTRGAAGMEELIGLFMGWGVPFIICLDDDKEGKAAQKKYIETWGIPACKVWTLHSFSEDLKNKEISGFLEPEDIELIKSYFNLRNAPTKSQIQLFFSEHLAKKAKVNISDAFKMKVKQFEEAIRTAFSE